MSKILLFYSDEDIFNFYADRLYEELTKRGHDVFILDMNFKNAGIGHTLQEFRLFREPRIDKAIAFNDIGFMAMNGRDGTFTYNQVVDITGRTDLCLVNIMMNPPYRFHSYFLWTPEQCINYAYDRDDVKYMLRVFPRMHSNFLPHAGTPATEPVTPYEERKINVLLTDDYEDPEECFAKITTMFDKDSPLFLAFRQSYELMKENTELSVTGALDNVLREYDIRLSQADKIVMYQNCIFTELAIKNYIKGKAFETLADSGLDITICGRGWERLPSAGKANIHIITDIDTHADRLKLAATAKINLNVMPWTKDGSNENVFNALLRDSLPITDPSVWLMNNLSPDKEAVYFNLDELERLPEIIRHYLVNPDKAKAIIERGKKKVEENWTWKQLADRIGV